MDKKEICDFQLATFNFQTGKFLNSKLFIGEF